MRFPLILLLSSLAACSGGNLGSQTRLSGPTPPPIRNPYFDPYAPPGSVPATWVAPTWDARGTIVRPRDWRVERGHEDYDNAPWIGSGGPDRAAGVF